MTYQFSPPTLGTYKRYTPQINQTTNLLKNIPGVGATGYKGAIPQNSTVLQRATEKETPLQTYQKLLKDRIAKTTQVTDQAKNQIRTKNGFVYKYGIKDFSSQFKQYAPSRNTSGATRGGWGGFRNGQIPVNALTPIGGGHGLRADAANAFVRMNAAFRQTFGRNIAVTDSYRPYARQVSLAQTKPNLAATPGTSNHGWGVALDLGGGINQHGTREHNWMRQYASQFGFGPLSGNKYQQEPWHWEYRG